MKKNQLISLHIKNFRSLADVKIKTESLTVLFGPNGAGKSTFLEALWLVRDCAILGVDVALSQRYYGMGARWDGAKEEEPISIYIETENILCEVSFKYAGERIIKSINPINIEIDNLLHGVHYYHARSAQFSQLRQPGTIANFGTQLNENSDNLWAVLYHLYDKQLIDKRYHTIMKFMQESFPSFREIVFEQSEATAVSASIIEKKRNKPIPICNVADGQLQMLMQLTALFSEQSEDNTLILLDEPEISLHPWALSVLADAVETATQKWNKQVLIATQSPVLISQFQPKNIFTAEIDDIGQTVMTPINEFEDKELLADY
jgi:predicted ATPase